MTESQNLLSLNKKFVTNTLKQVDDHNRKASNHNSKLLRKFQNEERKKYTVKNLDVFSPQKTLYSDLLTKKKRTNTIIKSGSKIITPFDQVQKIVLDAAEFDEKQDNMLRTRIKDKRLSVPKRVSVDKRLLKNHLKHTSVHNRLKEEEEMWEQHKVKQSKMKSSEFVSGLTGGLYSDREPGRVKPSRVRATPDELPADYIGNATRELLRFEESMPDRWGHSGFKEIHSEEINRDSSAKSSRRIIVSNDVRSRLNDSIELSDDGSENEVIPKKKKRKLFSHVVVHRKEKYETNSFGASKSIVRKNVIDKTDEIDEKCELEGKVTARERIRMNTLHADVIPSQNKNKRNFDRPASPKWAHDGFLEITDEKPSNVSKEVKNRLKFVTEVYSDDDISAAESRSSVQRKCKNAEDDVNEVDSIDSMCKLRGFAEIQSIQLSDSDEWTEKEVSSPSNRQEFRIETMAKKGRWDVRAKNEANKKSSYTGKNRSMLGDVRLMVNMDDASLQETNDTQINRTSSMNYSDSSFTDSSSDELYNEKIGTKNNSKSLKADYQLKR